MAATSRCTRPPAGWWCIRIPRHPGPCAARPTWRKRVQLWLRGVNI